MVSVRNIWKRIVWADASGHRVGDVSVNLKGGVHAHIIDITGKYEFKDGRWVGKGE